MRFTAAVTHEPPWYVARCLEIEVASQAESVEGALANLKEALELYFEDTPLPEGEGPDYRKRRTVGVTPALPVVSGAAVVKALTKIGLEHVSQRGSHVKLRHTDGRTVIVPLHRELARNAAIDPSPSRSAPEELRKLL